MRKLTRMEKAKFFNWVLSVLSVFMLGFVLLALYWVFRPYNIIEWKIDKYELQKDTYKVGDVLDFRTAFCKVGEYQANIVYHIEDGVTYLMPHQISRSPEGCRDFISNSLVVPDLPAGEYRLVGDISYEVNPFKTVHYRMESDLFNIVR